MGVDVPMPREAVEKEQRSGLKKASEEQQGRKAFLSEFLCSLGVESHMKIMTMVLSYFLWNQNLYLLHRQLIFNNPCSQKK